MLLKEEQQLMRIQDQAVVQRDFLKIVKTRNQVHFEGERRSHC